ncbi:hypothetical protein GQ600_5421 [Phytophthora cactorum]|nr:hypothetical protein GQ600_5421 [Phytophthora cactorum]
MRSCFIVIVALVALLTSNTASGIGIQSNASGRITQSAELKTNTGRALRAERQPFEPSDEERGILTNFVTKANEVLKEMRLKNFVRYQSIFIYTDDIGQKLLQKKVTPDQVYTYLRLDKVDNRVTILGKPKATSCGRNSLRYGRKHTLGGKAN